MDMISRAGLVVSIALCAGAGYLFFIPKQAVVDSGDTSQTVGVVREIAVPSVHDEQLSGSMLEFTDQSHRFIFDAAGRTYEELYGAQHIGEGGFKTFEGSTVPHQLKPLQLPFAEDKKYILLEGISENRVYQIVADTEVSLDLETFDGKPVRLVKQGK
jgi:hypothetical protein